MATQVIGFPMVNAGSLYINGLNLQWTSATAFAVTAGACRDATNQDDIVLPANATVSSAINGIGGLDIGTIANSTFYAVYAVGSSLSANPETNITQQNLFNPSNSPPFAISPVPSSTVKNNPQPGIMISTNVSAPVLPLNYDMSRRIGFVLTDGSAHFLAFWQTGDGNNRTMWYDALIAELSATAAAAFTAQDVSLAVPAAAANAAGNCEVIIEAVLDPAAAGDFVAFRPTGSSSTNGNVKMTGDVMSQSHTDQLKVVAALNSASPKLLSVDYLTDASSTAAFSVAGYVDNL